MSTDDNSKRWGEKNECHVGARREITDKHFFSRRVDYEENGKKNKKKERKKPKGKK